jgi:hypothetical protein
MTQMTQSIKIPSIRGRWRLGHPSAEPWPNRDPNDPIMQNAHKVKISVDNVKKCFTLDARASEKGNSKLT